MVGVVGIIISFSLLANNFLLPTYYEYRQEIAIKEAYASVVDTIKNDYENFSYNLSIIESRGMQVNVADENWFEIHGQRNFFMNAIGLPPKQYWTEEPDLYIRQDLKARLNYMSVLGKLTVDNATYYIIIDTPIETISASVGISNTFQLYTGLFLVVISGLLVLIFANRFLKPVLAVNQATKQMAKLDFSKRIKVTSNDEIGELAQNINILSDELEGAITRLQATNTQLQAELAHREQIDKMRQEFISNVSHELKTPIALIMGYTEGLKVNVNEDDRDFYCDVIGDEAQKMNKMVRRLLYVAQLDSGAMQPERTEFFINSVVDRCLNKHSILMKEKGVEAEVTAERDYLVDADIEQIEQVVSNYLTNALHHIDERKKLQIRITEQEGRVRVTVYNSGSAVPEESLPRLWDSFYKVDKARTREYGGTGLGLYIVRTIMEAHQGNYGVRNTEDGVEFWFELPIVSE